MDNVNFENIKKRLQSINIHVLRVIYRKIGGTPKNLSKKELIDGILKIQCGEEPTKSNKGRRPNEQKYQEHPDKPIFDIFKFAEDLERENIFPQNRENNDIAKDRIFQAEVSGVLEIHPEGYGFIRRKNYEMSGELDAYVSKLFIKNNKLRVGDYVEGLAEGVKNSSSPSLKAIKSVNNLPLEKLENRQTFDSLLPCYPTEKLYMEGFSKDLSLRVIDLLCPIGKGQRALIVAPPKTGKTTLLKKIASAIENNCKDTYLMVLLIDERPEEVTDFKNSIKSEVTASTFDAEPEHHKRIAELVLNRAKRLVELNKNVVILLDSLTKLTRAVNSTIPSSGKTLSGGLDAGAISMPKKFFGSARNISGGGSLTIIATALIETGSKMDEVIFEEFKGTGNMEIVLSKDLAEKRVFPAIDLIKSGTRKEELLLTPKELEVSYIIRKALKEQSLTTEAVLNNISKTQDNADFVNLVSKNKNL